jgi:S-formylglutathione hydrolase
VPALVYLAGLTCNEETFAIKAGAQRVAAELGLMLVTPDTSPRGTGVEGADAAWDFGTAAGFYLDATQAPWAHALAHGKLRRAGAAGPAGGALPAAGRTALGLFGHSMGGHGALTLALRHPGLFRSVSRRSRPSPRRCSARGA